MKSNELIDLTDESPELIAIIKDIYTQLEKLDRNKSQVDNVPLISMLQDLANKSLPFGTNDWEMGFNSGLRYAQKLAVSALSEFYRINGQVR